MMQQINLFKQIPVVEVKKVLLTIPRIIVLTVLTWVALVGFLMAAFVIRYQLVETVSQQEIEQKSAQNKLAELTRQYPEESKVALEEKSKEIEQQIAAKQALLNLLDQATATNGYSKRMEALAETITPDTWLTGIEMDDTSSFIGLAGKSFTSEGIFKFVDNLKANSEYQQIKFQAFNLKETEKDNLISFVLSSELGRVPAGAQETSVKGKRGKNAKQ